jgi:hypothetical protein
MGTPTEDDELATERWGLVTVQKMKDALKDFMKDIKHLFDQNPKEMDPTENKTQGEADKMPIQSTDEKAHEAEVVQIVGGVATATKVTRGTIALASEGLETEAPQIAEQLAEVVSKTKFVGYGAVALSVGATYVENKEGLISDNRATYIYLTTGISVTVSMVGTPAAGFVTGLAFQGAADVYDLVERGFDRTYRWIKGVETYDPWK